MRTALPVRILVGKCLIALRIRTRRAMHQRRLLADDLNRVEALESRILLTSDFGDAPLPYPTTLAENGARHTATGLTMGANRDSTETNGVHSVNADADGADEDGVSFGTLRTGDLTATVTVNVQGAAGKLDAWIDFNGDGSWGGPGEQIFAARSVAVGDNVLSFAVPSTALRGTTYARFRLSTAGGLGTGGAASDGEVEDYLVTIEPPSWASGSFGSANVITDTTNGANSVFAADIDADGDLDVLSASIVDHTIAWFENDGSQNFLPRPITNTAFGAFSVFAADIDADGDLDVLGASIYDHTIAWFENDGSQSFTPHTITNAANGAVSVIAADVDADGDLDVLSASVNDQTIAWFENDGSQNFTQRTITSTAAGAASVFAADVDGDGDLDVLSASSGDDTIAWYENNGSQSFTAHTITTAGGATSVFAADIDADGDLDVLGASVNDDTIAWYENDGSQNFTQRSITRNTGGTASVFAADVDGDGDLDVLGASRVDNTITWFENDGSQSFTRRTITSTAGGAASVFAADVDGDGDLDVLGASRVDNTIAWYENFVFDFGDAPGPYPTTAAENGARHDSVGPTLGATRDPELDGTHSPNADADGPDEDGVLFGMLRTGDLAAAVTVNVQGAAGKLDAWIDFNGDGSWGGPDEQIFAARTVAVGDNPLIFAVPPTAHSGPAYARFRLSTTGGLGVGGTADDGEVEDFRVTIEPPAPASGTFGSASVITSAALGADGLHAADVDGDGDLDVFSSSYWDNSVAWFENNGNQNFTAHTITTAATGATSVFATDMDGDGDIDALSSARTAGEIAWYQNDGLGNFTRLIISSTASGANAVFAADVDGDGDIDVLSASLQGDSATGDTSYIAWYENNGSQNFTPRHVSSTILEATNVYAADVDGDGRLDILSSSNDSEIAWHQNMGESGFITRTISGTAARPWGVFAADLNDDGHIDVLSASRNDKTIAWYENDGNANFTRRVIASDAVTALIVSAADVDGDGDLDVLSASQGDDKIAWYENNGNGSFKARVISTTAIGAASVFAADVDSDGDLDVLSASWVDNKIAWYENFNSDLGDAPSPYPTTLAEDGARHAATGLMLGASRDSEADSSHSATADGDGADEDGVTFGILQTGDLTATVTVNVQGGPGKLDAWIDFNGDGSWGGPGEQIFAAHTVAVGNNVLSFAVPSTAISGTTYARFRLSTTGGLGVGGAAGNGEVEDYRVNIEPPGSASGIFGAASVITNAAIGANSVFAADVDADGDIDVLGASYANNTIAWFENDGNQNFAPRTITNTADGAWNVFAADVDADGDLDVLSASYIDDTIAWFENDGNQHFTQRTITNTADGAVSVFPSDVDGDGDVDIVSASYFDNTIAWFENDGNQNFNPHTITNTASGAFSVFAADVDGDGDIDVLSASFFDDTVTWFENDGNQNFTPRTITSTADGVASVFAADVDGDGDIDILAASIADNTIAWFENDGKQSFTSHTITNTADYALSVFAADVDGDGDLDVLGASRTDDTIAWFENDGNRSFTLRNITSTADGAASVFAADIDGDGDLDVLSASRVDNTIAWFENRGLLTVEFAANSIAENGGSLLGTVTRGTTDFDQPLIVNLNSDDTTEATVPSQVTIPAHQTSVSFTLTVVDDPLLDGTQTVTISAAANGYLAHDATVDITDHETPLEMIAPAGITDDMTPQLTWNAVGGADRYEIWVRNLTTKERVADQNDIQTTSFTPTTPWDGTNYRVWVRAFSAAGEEGPWSSGDFRFRIRNAPQITAPTVYRTTDSTPTLAWDPIPDTQWGTPQSFEVWIKRHQTKHDHVLEIPGPGYTTEPLPMGRYNFWVRGILPGGLESGWSRAREVVIVTPPTLTGPTGTSNSLTPTISWNALPGASTYELFLADLTTGQSPLLQPTGIQTTTWTVSQPLTSGHSYKVWARAYDEKGWRGYYGSPIEFNIAGPVETRPQPTDNEQLPDEQPLQPLLLALLDRAISNSDFNAPQDAVKPTSQQASANDPTAQESATPRTPSVATSPHRRDKAAHEQIPNDTVNIHGPTHQTVSPDPIAAASTTDKFTVIDRVLGEWAASDLAFQ